MKLLLSTILSALILVVSMNAQNVIILEDDFDTTDGLGTGNNAGKLTIVSDPADSGRGNVCLLYTSPSPRDGLLSRMPSSA